jgi:uncharacterized protein YwgA
MDPLIRRIALLVELADRRKANRRLGKTALQKFAYLLQELLGEQLGYQFQFYSYGPYDSMIMGDIDYAAALGCLNVSYDQDKGYEIRPGSIADQLESERDTLRIESGSNLDRLFHCFGSDSARELELLATIVYTRKDEPSFQDEQIIKRVQDLKPKYSANEIKKAFDKLKGMEEFQCLASA